MKTIFYKGHKIEVPGMSATGMERILYDGKAVSAKRSLTGATHVFRVTEGGEEVQYEVELGTRWHGFTAWATIRRNGVTIYTDR